MKQRNDRGDYTVCCKMDKLYSDYRVFEVFSAVDKHRPKVVRS